MYDPETFLKHHFISLHVGGLCIFPAAAGVLDILPSHTLHSPHFNFFSRYFFLLPQYFLLVPNLIVSFICFISYDIK